MSSAKPTSALADVEQNGSEEQLVSRAIDAVSQCRWVVGECAAQWTQRYARGRTDADFGLLIGLSGDQIYQRRRVWEAFADVRAMFTQLKWSHFYAALTWEDAQDCLYWADENRATVAEMKAWRRAQRGEDLTAEAEVPEAGEHFLQYSPHETVAVQDPSDFGMGAAGGQGAWSPPFDVEGDRPEGGSPERMMAAARDLDGKSIGEYAPFRADAGSGAPKERGEHSASSAAPISPEQLVKRLTSTLERCEKVLTPEFLREFQGLPQPLKTRLFKAFDDFSERLEEMR